MSKPVSTIRCVYCKEEKPRPRKGEHIILDGLGGRATTRLVCSDCNQLFGNGLDREFLRSGLIALHRFLDPTVTDGRAEQVQFVPTEFGFIDAYLLNNRKLDLLPQVGVVGTKKLVVAAEPDRPLLEGFLASLHRFDRSTMLLHWDIRDRDEHVPARIVVSRQGKTHLLRARSNEDAEALLAVVSRPATSSGWKDLQVDERMNYRSSVDVNIPGRCAAKMAFNLAAEVLGPDVLLADAFDGVRAYIVGSDVQSGSAVAPSGELGVVIDRRYVDPWIGVERTRTLPEGHAILLFERGGVLVGQVSLFRGMEHFNVWLGRLRPPDGGTFEALTAFWSRPDGDWWVPPNGFPWRHDEPPIQSRLPAVDVADPHERPGEVEP